MNYTDLEYRVFTQKSEADKAINSLVGILQGISLDGVINEKERQELSAWATVHTSMIQKKGFNEFMYAVNNLLFDDTADKSELIQDLNWLCQQYGPENYYYNVFSSELQTLQGVLHGVMADGILHDQEIHSLSEWIDNNSHLAHQYPYDEIKSLLLNVLSDGKIDDDERKMLMAYFNQFINIQSPEIRARIDSSIKGITISGHCTSDPKIEFENKLFCVTGVLRRDSRSNLHQAIQGMGGIIAKDVVKNLDYLIVGDNGNPAWAFACYGRKVEKAILHRKEGSRIQIIHEFDMFDHLDDLK